MFPYSSLQIFPWRSPPFQGVANWRSPPVQGLANQAQARLHLLPMRNSNLVFCAVSFNCQGTRAQPLPSIPKHKIPKHLIQARIKCFGTDGRTDKNTLRAITRLRFELQTARSDDLNCNAEIYPMERSRAILHFWRFPGGFGGVPAGFPGGSGGGAPRGARRGGVRGGR